MHKFIIFFLFQLYISVFSQELVKVTFKVISKNLSNTTNIFITGNDEKLGNWNPGLTKLQKTSDSTWEKQFLFKVGTILEFKFTQGSWRTEALDKYGNIPKNHAVDIEKDTVINFFISEWNNDQLSTDFIGQITGTVKYHKNIEFDGLESRDIIVWLPPNYDKSKNKHYPVLYMHDGQNIFDPKTSFLEVDWQMDEAADSLIKHNTIEPIIIVGIYNTSNRSDEYSPTISGELYMKFVVNKLKPMIDSLYRTKPERRFTSIGGSSMGGLISFMLAWNYTDVFSKAACFSPAFKYKDFDYTEKVKDYSNHKKNLTFYIYNGGLGLEQILQPGVDLMISELKNKGYIINKDLFVFTDKNAEHNEEAWAKRVPNLLKLFFGIDKK